MPGVVVAGGVLVVAVEIGSALAGRKPVEECAFGVSGQVLDHSGYCVTVVAGEASEPSPCLNADEKLNALLGAVDAEMALAIALLLLGRGQSHDRLRCRAHGTTVAEPPSSEGTGPRPTTDARDNQNQCRLTPRDNELAKASLNGNHVRAHGRQILILIDAPFSSRLSRYTGVFVWVEDPRDRCPPPFANRVRITPVTRLFFACARNFADGPIPEVISKEPLLDHRRGVPESAAASKCTHSRLSVLQRSPEPSIPRDTTCVIECCARAVSGHATAAPPISDMNSHRLMSNIGAFYPLWFRGLLHGRLSLSQSAGGSAPHQENAVGPTAPIHRPTLVGSFSSM
jgi:hypothetical protein